MAFLSSKKASSSSSTHGRKYDVYISFRGENNRQDFTNDLYEELRRKNIHVFRVDEELPEEEVIASELTMAIEESQYAIVILSEKYADSKWCLDELVKIVECRKKTGLTVLPVFYDVDPSHVQHQTGHLAIALAKHEQDDTVNIEKMKKWKDALREVACLSGWHLNQR